MLNKSDVFRPLSVLPRRTTLDLLVAEHCLDRGGDFLRGNRCFHHSTDLGAIVDGRHPWAGKNRFLDRPTGHFHSVFRRRE